ncbi:MAG: hypothetical protein U0105_18485 [Candidatus Obscuribacterales bacterium]
MAEETNSSSAANSTPQERCDITFSLAIKREGRQIKHTFDVDVETDSTRVESVDSTAPTRRVVDQRPEVRTERFYDLRDQREVLNRETTRAQDGQWITREVMHDGGNVRADRITVATRYGVPLHSTERHLSANRVIFEAVTTYTVEGGANTTIKKYFDFEGGHLTRTENILWHPSGTAAVSEISCYDTAGSERQFSKIIHDDMGIHRWEERTTFSGGSHNIPLAQEIILYNRSGKEAYRDAVYYDQFGQVAQRVSDFVSNLQQIAENAQAPRVSDPDATPTIAQKVIVQPSSTPQPPARNQEDTEAKQLKRVN